MTDLSEIKPLVQQVHDRVLSDAKRLDAIEARLGRASMPGAFGMKGLDTDEHALAFKGFLRNPHSAEAQTKLAAIEQKTASGATDAAGGFMIPSIILGPLMKRLADGNPLRDLVRQVQVATRDVSFPLSNGNATTGWVGETDTRTGTTEPTLIAPKPTFGTVYALLEATEELVMDSAFDVASWFAMEAADKMSEAEAEAIVSGDGTNKPTGLLDTAPVETADGSRTAGVFKCILSGHASQLPNADPLVRLVYDLKAGYRTRGTWVMNSATAAAVMQFKLADRYLWSESLAAGQPASLIGYPVVICEAMPDIGEDAFPIAFGDWDRAYILASNGGMRITIDNNVTTPGKVKWYMRQRLGGIPFDDNAVRFLKIAAPSA
jgi:HK97 family phage major capsid protein